MTPIDLLDFTDGPRKIPRDLLKDKSLHADEVKTWKILFAFLMDFYIVSILALVTHSFSLKAFQSFMITKKLHDASITLDHGNFLLVFCPTMLLSYFFFSFFFNEGQSYGMKVFKHRIHLRSKSLSSSLICAFSTVLIIFSGGLLWSAGSHWMAQTCEASFQQHDHLYHWLMSDKNHTPINLLEEVERWEEEAEYLEENFPRAA